MNNSLWRSPFFAEIREKCKLHSWAENALQRLTQQTVESFALPLNIPLTEGGWSHNYNCPNEGSKLQLIDRHHHQCPVCGSVWSGTPWDEVAIANEHWRSSMKCRSAAILFGITGDSKWAAWSREILLFYAAHYEQYPLHDKIGGIEKTAGKVQCQTLSEASWLIPLAHAFIILKHNDGLDAHEQKEIVDNLLLPALRVIENNKAGKSNWQTYHNAAKAVVADATSDRSLMEQAIYEANHSFTFQMENSLGEDGFWYEGSWGYHFYTLEAQVMIVQAAVSFGIDLYENPRFQAMFKAPLACMFPDGTLPPIHDDMGGVSVKRYAHLFEFSALFFGVGGQIVKESERDSLYSLLFGTAVAEEEEQDRIPAREFVQLKRSGMLVLNWAAEPRDTGQMAMIDYGEHGGSHGHQDKLNILFYAQGHPWLNDGGTLPYGNPLHQGFFKQTIAHNTVAIGGKSQAAAEGALRITRITGDDSMEAISTVEGTYPGVYLQRKIIMGDSFLLDVFNVRCEQEQDVDWIIQTQGIPVSDPTKSSTMATLENGALGTYDGYALLKEIRKMGVAPSIPALEWQWDQHEHTNDRLIMHLIGEQPDEEVYLAESPAIPSMKRRSTAIRRRRGVKETTFITLFQVCQEGAAPINMQCEANPAGTPQMLIVQYPDRAPLCFSLEMTEC